MTARERAASRAAEAVARRDDCERTAGCSVVPPSADPWDRRWHDGGVLCRGRDCSVCVDGVAPLDDIPF